MPRARSSALGRQPVTHERHRRGAISGGDGGLADGGRLAGGGRIDGTAGEVDGGARLAVCRWLRPGACGEPATDKRGWRDARPPGGVRRSGEGCDEVCQSVSNRVGADCHRGTWKSAGRPATSSSSSQMPAANVDPHCWLKARNAFAEVRALPGVSVSPV